MATKLRFVVTKPRAATPKDKPPFFVIEQDAWNDYSFQTQYHLSHVTRDAAGALEETLIGTVKILKRGQTAEDTLQITKDFASLGEEYCSVGQSLDYYERLRALGEPTRSAVLTALRDSIHTPAIAEQFNNEKGWGVSLFRDQTDSGAAFRMIARGVLTGDYSKIPSETMQFSFSITGWATPFDFKFDARTGDDFFTFHKNPLPERIAVLVGRNGSGKSTVLARLARVAFATLDERDLPEIAELGRLEPPGIGFPRIISVAFSSLDSFRLPGADDRNKRQTLKEVRRGEGRFVFIGLRDMVTEVENELRAGLLDDIFQVDLFRDRVGQTSLKSIDKLATEFATFVQRLHARGRGNVLSDLLSTLVPSGEYDVVALAQPNASPDDHKRTFLGASTGHKIVLLTVTGLLANIERYSLVLIDEPESHLHPPLLAALMHSLRRILRDHEAFGVIATHSPVVVQESLARHVRIVRREGSAFAVQELTGETFGESIGLISAEVFGLQTDATDYHTIVDRLIAIHRTLEAIESLFLGGSLSHQARAYVMSRLETKKQ